MLASSGLMTAPCGSSFLGRLPSLHALHDSCFQEFLDQFEQPSVGDFLPHFFHEFPMRDRVEIGFQVRIHHPVVAAFEQPVHPAQGVFASLSGPKLAMNGSQEKSIST